MGHERRDRGAGDARRQSGGSVIHRFVKSIRPDASFGGDVQAWENEVGYAEGERPAASVLMGGCVKAVEVP